MKTNLDLLNKVAEKYLISDTADFILRERLCDKCLKKFIKKNKLEHRKDLYVVQLLSICNKCAKGGIVYYIKGKL